MQPKVSIITTTYNDADNLSQIVKRVYAQDYPEIEYIIVDGGSTDHTMSVIQSAKELFEDRLLWISEKDSGIYDAINKGLKLATGDIIGTMFDTFTSEHVISEMVETMQREGTDGVHGDINYVDGERIVRKWCMGEGSIYKGWMPGHPTLYLKKEVYEKYGFYKTDYRIAADYEFIVRILKNGDVKLSYIPEVLVNMFYGGTSTGSFSSYVDSFMESLRVLKENHVKHPLLINIMRTFRVVYQFVRK